MRCLCGRHQISEKRVARGIFCGWDFLWLGSRMKFVAHKVHPVNFVDRRIHSFGIVHMKAARSKTLIACENVSSIARFAGVGDALAL